MPRTLPWTDHLTAQGKRPLFYAKLALKHQAFTLGLYDLLPGPIQGRLAEWDDLFFQQRGGQDDVTLKVLNSPLAGSLGKAIRCRGANDGANYDGNGIVLRTSGTLPYAPQSDQSCQILFRAWQLSKLTANGSLILFRLDHFRFVLTSSGTIALQVHSGGSWVTACGDTGGYKEGELCSIGFAYNSTTKVWTYFRRSDTGDFTTSSSALQPTSTSAATYVYVNGDGAGSGQPHVGTEGRYCQWIDVDEFRYWDDRRTQAEFNAAARRTLLPSEAFDANLVVWHRFDSGNDDPGSPEGNDDPLNPPGSTAVLYFENTSSLLTSPANPVFVSGLTRDRFGAQVEKDYPLEGATVEVYMTFADPISKTPVLLFRGRVKEVTDISREVVELDCVDISESAHKDIGTPVDATNYPYAPSESIGKIIPEVFGAVTDHECVPTQVTQTTRLKASAISTDTTISVETTTSFPSSGTIRIDDEEINYTGKTATTFTGCTRGVNGTTAGSHVTGATVEWVTSERYEVANHAVAAITNIRGVSSKGELVPVTGGTPTLTAPARVTFTKPVRIAVAGEGSVWINIEVEGPSGFNTAINPGRAAGLHADFTETNYAVITAANPKLSIERTSAFQGPANAGGVIKVYAVFEHHLLDVLSAGASVAARLEAGGVLVSALGNLALQFSTPAAALQTGGYYSESAGFEAAHQHQLPGGFHEHGIGEEELSAVIRPIGSPTGWASETTPTIGQATGTSAPTFTATQFFNVAPSATRLAVDGDPDTGYGLALTLPTNAYFPFPFGHLSGTNRQIKKVRIVGVISGPDVAAGNSALVLVVRGSVIATIPSISPSQLTINARHTVLSPIVDTAPLNISVADLLAPDSWIGVRNGTTQSSIPSGTNFLNVWELYLEVQLDEAAPSTTEIRPAYDNWLKPLPNIRDGSPESFEPKHFIANEIITLISPPGAPAAGYINPNPPVNGCDIPFNNQAGLPSLKMYFTELDNPQAKLKSAILKIAHTNTFAGAASLFGGTAPINAGPFPGGTGIPAIAAWNPLTPNPVAPRYQVRLVIKGQVIGTFTYYLDRWTDTPAVQYGGTPALVPPLGLWSRPMFGGGGDGQNPPAWSGACRVESTSGWQDLLGLAPAGGDFVVGDLIDPNSYIEIVLPAPTLIDQVALPAAYNPFNPPAANFPNQLAAYGNYAKRCQKIFDVALEVVAQNQEIALPTSVGDTDQADPLDHSSLTWFDITATWLLTGGWNAMQGVELVALATSFIPQDGVRILRADFRVEFGTIAYENTRRIVVDVDQGGGGNPIDHVDRIVTDYIGDATLEDAAAFAAAKALVRTDAAGVVRETINSGDLIAKILEQYSCSWFWEAGKLFPLFKPAISSIAAGSPSLTVDDVARGTVKVSRTPLDGVVNKVYVKYGPNAVTGGWKDTYSASSSASITAYGSTKTKTVEADWIQTAAAAAAYASTLLDYGDHCVDIVEFTTYLNGLAIVRGDVAQLVHDLVSSTKLEVLEMGIEPPARIRFKCADRTKAP